MGGDSCRLSDAERGIDGVPLASPVSDDLDGRQDGGAMGGVQSGDGDGYAEIRHHHSSAHGVGRGHPTKGV